MKLGRLSQMSCEYEMQEKMRDWLHDKGFKYVDEFYVKEVSRRPDFLVFKIGNGLINIEAKCHDFTCLINQLKDNSKYCNYSFAFITNYGLTPKWFKNQLSENGFGLIVYNEELKVVTEVLESHKNKTDLKLNKIITNRVRESINKKEFKTELF